MFTELSLLRPKRLRRANFSRADFLTKNENALIKPALFDFCYELQRKRRITPHDIKDLVRNYHADRAVEWYQRENFIFQCVNEALNTGNVEHIYLLRHYITDLHERICTSKHQRTGLNSSFLKTEINASRSILYRVIRLSERERKTLESLVGQLVTNRSFMSASRSKDVALEYSSQKTQTTESNLLLFEINIDLNSPVILDTDITTSEHALLLDFGIRFRVTKCEFDTKDNVWVCGLETAIAEPAFIQQSALVSLNDCLLKLNSYENDDTRINTTIDDRRPHSARISEIKSLSDNTNRELPFTSRPIEWAHVLQIKALVEWKQKNLLKLSNEWIQAIQIYAQCDTKYHYDDLHIIYCLNNVGYIYHLFGKDSLAIQLIKTSLMICRRQLLAEQPVFAQTCRNLGYIFANLGDYKTALDYHKRAIKVTRQSSPSAQWTTVLTLRNMGDICHRSGNFPQAHTYYRKAADAYKKCMDIFIASGYLEFVC
ncbi:unnamed protein product [Rotaria socialis]|uniref:Tetratricopeptide repeat protein n=1 Tax=Rotaria socialis TaxID=392032 RepID=A0A820MBT0_9BILA|nr:unnamed protein product [Rotaria socialis]CAF3328868.1 unnamed protein product [Rotaria socialis]CAF4370197.1 unnamed protein product [Rotaria socialis]CAF4565064.1 unnamed protein product [Rotaria socialis]